jgi:precorrin-6Y C5,15-methyltransferase (decarboxylating)
VNARVEIVGVAPGAAALPEEAGSAVRSCSLLVGARRHLELLPDFAGEVLPLEGNTSAAVEVLVRRRDVRAAVLASGDPGFFGIAASVLRALPRDEVRIWPAVSSMQLAFARIGEAWSEARFASLHGRPLEELAPVLGAVRIGLFTDPRNGPAEVARFLLDAGWDDLEMVVLEDLGLPTERLSRGPPSELTGWKGSGLNLVLLLRTVADSRPLGPGVPDAAFSRARGLITKAEIRSVALGLLRLPRTGVLWDVGAGSGSVAVEACLLAPGLRAFALEKSAQAFADVVENRRRFRAAGLTPVRGEAPAVFEGLPDPDSVFVGGSGGRLGELLEGAWARLKEGGRLVVSSVLLETAAEALWWGDAGGRSPEIVQVQAARGRVVIGRHLLEPHHPVTLLAWTKPGGGAP